MATAKYQQISVLASSTYAFTIAFMVWTMFGEIGVPIAEALGLSSTQFGILTSLPVLTGSLCRLPLGMLTDRFGGRPVFIVALLLTVVPIWLVQYATAYWHLLVLGLFVGLSGATFTVGITYVARFFPSHQQGFAMGIFGAGNAGAALTKYIAPTLIVLFSWQAVPAVYAVIMAATVVIFWFTTWPEPGLKERQAQSDRPSLREQFSMLKDPKVLKYCQYYSVVFGGFVGVSLWLTKHYMTEFDVGIQFAAAIATVFVLPSGVVRAFGGWLSDRFGAHTVTWWCMWSSLICLFFMSYPYTEYAVETLDGDMMRFSFGLNIWIFTALLFVVGIAWGVGKASVFKYISNEYGRNLGVVSGIVGLAGGMGGFLLPIMFGALVDLTGISTSVFMLLFGVVMVSLIWMWWTERRPVENDTTL